MTKARGNFNECMLNDFEEYKLKMLQKSNEEIFNNAYDIAKYEEIKGCLTEIGSIVIDELVKMNVTNILQTLFEYEWGYDYAMWSAWDDIETMIKDCIDENQFKAIGKNKVDC